MSEFRFGEGRISGVLSVTLGLLCIGAVACFHYPEVLTTPELRAIYPIPFLRKVLSFFIFVSMLLGVLSFGLSRQKLLSLLGILFSSVAILMGGSTVPVPDSVRSPSYIGLDWFVLDLLVVGLVFIPIERLYCRLRDQKIFRQGWKVDLIHFFFGHVLIQVTSFLILKPSLVLSPYLSYEPIRTFIQSQPDFVQLLEIIFVADLAQYWIHRAFHQIPYLWRFHAVHHSIQELDWLAGSRLHLVDVVITRGLVLLPLFILGFGQGPVQAYLVLVAFWATFDHINIRFEFPVINQIVATPIYHHWHHGSEAEAIDKNFATHLPILDRLFGTQYLPRGSWPNRYGIHEGELPDSYFKQMIDPFYKKLS
jgi:lathosterol oxidase